jgi:hypothetical protein
MTQISDNIVMRINLPVQCERVYHISSSGRESCYAILGVKTTLFKSGVIIQNVPMDLQRHKYGLQIILHLPDGDHEYSCPRVIEDATLKSLMNEF